jgi:hypothetical protein
MSNHSQINMSSSLDQHLSELSLGSLQASRWADPTPINDPPRCASMNTVAQDNAQMVTTSREKTPRSFSDPIQSSHWTTMSSKAPEQSQSQPPENVPKKSTGWSQAAMNSVFTSTWPSPALEQPQSMTVSLRTTAQTMASDPPAPSINVSRWADPVPEQPQDPSCTIAPEQVPRESTKWPQASMNTIFASNWPSRAAEQPLQSKPASLHGSSPEHVPEKTLEKVAFPGC